MKSPTSRGLRGDHFRHYWTDRADGLRGRHRRGHVYREGMTMADKECCLKSHGACSGALKTIILSDGSRDVCHTHGLLALAAAWHRRTGN
jgi:hypothetical protein